MVEPFNDHFKANLLSFHPFGEMIVIERSEVQTITRCVDSVNKFIHLGRTHPSTVLFSNATTHYTTLHYHLSLSLRNKSQTYQGSQSMAAHRGFVKPNATIATERGRRIEPRTLNKNIYTNYRTVTNVGPQKGLRLRPQARRNTISSTLRCAKSRPL